MDCSFDPDRRRIWCEAIGYNDSAWVTWDVGIGSGAQGGTFEYLLVEDWQLVPETVVTVQDCGGSSCTTIQVEVDTSSTALPVSEVAQGTTSSDSDGTAAVAELGAVCSFDEPQRRLACHAVGQSRGTQKWTTNLNTREGSGNTYETTLEWGQFVDEIHVQIEDCTESDCSVATWSTTVVLEPRGDCPENFTGWFTTFPLDDHTLIYEVGPPGRIDPDVYRGHGYFRVPTGMNAVDVRMPIDATLFTGSNHYEDAAKAVSEIRVIQYRLEFRTECEGIRFRFDHIAEPVPEIVALFTREPLVDSSYGMELEPLFLNEGDLVGTKIGTEPNGNAAVDFGVYDDFKRAQTAQDPRFYNAACFYKFFSPTLADYLSAQITRVDNLAPGLCS